MTTDGPSSSDVATVHVGASMTALILDSTGAIAPQLPGLGSYELDHLSIGDHVTFHDDLGLDGLLHAACVLSAQDKIPMQVGVYLLALRHPTVVARQIADLERIHPGRLSLAVGVGGEDRREYLACGVDPAVRGRRTDEAISVLRALLTGSKVSFHGRHFELDGVVIAPAPARSVPILVGGRSDHAIRRTAHSGDGWLGMWVSVERFAAAVARIGHLAAEHGRSVGTWRHGMVVWTSVDRDPEIARARLAAHLHARYRMPFERFAKWCPTGRPEQVAHALAEYVEAGCRSFTLTLPNSDVAQALDSASTIRAELSAMLPQGVSMR